MGFTLNVILLTPCTGRFKMPEPRSTHITTPETEYKRIKITLRGNATQSRGNATHCRVT